MDSTSRIPLDLRERLNAITAWAFPGRGRFKALANASGISFDSWKGTWHNKQRPTTEMVQFVARAWPQFAFWLATGITDLAHGHQAPEGSENFLETMYRPRAGAEPYFRHMVDMLERRERGEPELPTDLVELRALAVARENDELSARAADSMSDGATLALTVQELDADTQPNVETRTGRLLAELQEQRQLDDERMATLLRVDVETYRAAKTDKDQVHRLSAGRIFDAWAYDAVRDALLKVAPDRFADAIRQRDIERGRRLIDGQVAKRDERS